MEEIKILGKSLAEKNAEFLAQYPTDDAQIDYYTNLAMATFREFQIDGSFKVAGVHKNVEEWYTNKKKQIEIFRNHPYWNEAAKAIIFTQTETRAISYNRAKEALAKIYHYIRSKKSNISLNFIEDVYGALSELIGTADETPEINQVFLNHLNRRIRNNDTEIPKRIKSMLTVGTKISKLVHKYCTMIPYNGDFVDATKFVDDHAPGDRNFFSFDKYYAKFADYLSELTVNKLTVVSLHFCDFMTMSNGNSWLSCHYINSHNLFHEDTENASGCYKQGCLSYALDEPSFLIYTLPDTYEGNEYYRMPKLTRMCCQYQNGVLITSKCYPDNGDDIIARYRQMLQQIISVAENNPNLWTFSRKIDRVMAFVLTHPEATHYPDYRHEEKKPTVSICRNSAFDIDKPMVIGHESYCLHCGTKFNNSSWLQCEDHRKPMICAGCGCYTNEDEELHKIGNAYYCDDCIFYCDYHQKYELISNQHGVIETHTGNITVCKSAIGAYKKCDNCGKYILYTDDVCKSCNTENAFELKIVSSETYKKGDYVLIHNASDCEHGCCAEMLDYNGRIVRIINKDRGNAYKTSAIPTDPENGRWIWSRNCFAGIVVGANDAMIGMKIK